MEETDFVESGREAWERLAAASKRAREEGVTRLDALTLRQMHDDYRRAAADLAYAQTHFADSESETYLNAVVAQAHGELYGASPRRLGQMWEFLARGWPRLVRANARPILLSAALIGGALVLGYVLSYVDYPLARLFVPEQLRESVADAFKQSEQGRGLSVQFAPVVSAFLAVNNVQVAVLAFAGGITFGLITVYALLANGLLLGALAGVFAQAGLALDFWALIVPHGSVELPAIAFAGGAGLMLARALLFPGDLGRMASLRRASGDAVRVVLGTLPLFAVAALVEGFVTPRPLDPALKLAIGAALALLLAAYVGLPGRKVKV